LQSVLKDLRPVSIDTNIFANAAGVRRVSADAAKVELAKAFIINIAVDREIAVAAQVFADLHFVLIRRGGVSGDEAARRIAKYHDLCFCIPTTSELLSIAFSLASRHNLQTYDAIILAAAAEAGCDILYSEDMQHGFVWRGVEVINPFI
jgi:predicted nucleic acid-binding protein